MSTPTSEAQRLPLSLDWIEAIIAIFAAILAWYSFRYILEHTAPWCSAPPPVCEERYHPPYYIGYPLFRQFAFPMAVIVSLSAVSLTRALRGGIRYFTRPGQFLLSLPLFTFLFLYYDLWITLCLPSLLIIYWCMLSTFVTIQAIVTRRNYGDLIVLPLNLAWLWFGYIYFLRWYEIYGD